MLELEPVDALATAFAALSSLVPRNRRTPILVKSLRSVLDALELEPIALAGELPCAGELPQPAATRDQTTSTPGVADQASTVTTPADPAPARIATRDQATRARVDGDDHAPARPRRQGTRSAATRLATWQALKLKLREAMADRTVSRDALAAIVGIQSKTLTTMLGPNRNKLPSDQLVGKLRDWLAGVSLEPRKESPEAAQLARLVKARLVASHMSPATVASRIGVGAESVAAFCQGDFDQPPLVLARLSDWANNGATAATNGAAAALG